MKRLLYILLLPLLFYGCGNDEDPIKQDDCPEDIACTEIFVMLTFTPKDENDQPIRLDSFYTQNLDNGNTYDGPSRNDLIQEGTYVVISDGELEEINMEGTLIRFFGIVNDRIVIEQDFEVGHDCCHVQPLNGPFNQ